MELGNREHGLPECHYGLFRAAAQERVELELIDGRQMWPSAVRDYTRSEHCEGHFGAWCIVNYYTLCIPCCVEAAIGGCCDCCCCYTARRRKKLRDRYKLKGTVCTDYLLQCPMWCVIGGCAFNAYQEVRASPSSLPPPFFCTEKCCTSALFPASQLRFHTA